MPIASVYIGKRELMGLRNLPNCVMAVILATLACVSAGLFVLLRPPAAPKEPTLAEAPSYSILIQIDEKKLYLLQDGKLVKKYTVATGKRGDPSPIGDWVIVNKYVKEGKAFGARWLGLNVSWGIYGIHGTNDEGTIGGSVSHGCIRMHNRDIKELFNLVPVGTPVAIRNGIYGPFGSGYRKLSFGDRGADVLAVQQRLKALGYFEGIVNGIFGEHTRLALRAFQQDHDLNVKDTITREDYLAMGLLQFD